MDGGQLIFHPIRLCPVVAVRRRRDQILRPRRGLRFLPASGEATSSAVRDWLFRWVSVQSRNLGFVAAGFDDHVDVQRRRIFSACERSILDPHAGNLVQYFVAGANDCGRALRLLAGLFFPRPRPPHPPTCPDATVIPPLPPPLHPSPPPLPPRPDP